MAQHWRDGFWVRMSHDRLASLPAYDQPAAGERRHCLANNDHAATEPVCQLTNRRQSRSRQEAFGHNEVERLLGHVVSERLLYNLHTPQYRMNAKLLLC